MRLPRSILSALLLPLLACAALALSACADDDYGQPKPDIGVAAANGG